ncbi:MerR family transcriptional regulator [Ottowia sp.]|uniref:MerR family transcriptional regulator n=1 Tax=Ottowia sp. TaxID=1898956 RepID=UPI0026273808|nr:MerR family transcriptional regulator [Ottowia sp.]
MESLLSIEEAARRTGLTAHTLRYYERIGLIAPVGRAAGGQRRYAASDMAIGKMQAFARLRGAGDSTVPDRRQMLEEHLTDVLAEIAAMRRSAAALQAKIAHYRSLEQSLAPDSTSDEGHADAHRQPPLRTRTRKTA